MATSTPSMDPITPDPELIRQAQAGSRKAQAILVEHYWDRLYRWLFHLTRDAHTAEDLTQDSFLKALANLKRFKADTNFAAWLFRIGHNNFANHCRSRQRQKEALPEGLPDQGPGPEEEVLSKEALRILAHAIERMPVELRGALLLRAEEGLSFRQIAEILDLTEETARWRVFRARQKLLQAIEPAPDKPANPPAESESP